MRATTEQELIEAVAPADAGGEPVLVLGGGSNLVVADAGFAGTVVEVATAACTADVEGDDPTCGGVLVTVAAGESWDDLRRRTPSSAAGSASRRWPASPAWSAPPRSRTSAPTARRSPQTIASVRVWDRVLKGVRTFANADCGFGYRTSRFKADPGRHVVLDVTFQLRQGSLGAPVQYAELARTLGVELGAARPAGRRPRGRPGAAPRQGHGPRPGRPRHLERRLVLHQPGRRRRRRARRTPRPGRSPTAGSRPAPPG